MGVLEILAFGTMMACSCILGYLMGMGRKPKEIADDVLQIKKDLVQKSTPVGTVTRPSAETVLSWGNPNRLEEDTAFKESFSKTVKGMP